MAALTPRELEVIERIAEGDSTKAMSFNLGCQPRTIIAHVQNIKAKLRAKTRAHIIVKAVRAGSFVIKSLLLAFVIFNCPDDMRRGQRTRVRNQSASGRAASRYSISA